MIWLISFYAMTLIALAALACSYYFYLKYSVAVGSYMAMETAYHDLQTKWVKQRLEIGVLEAKVRALTQIVDKEKGVFVDEKV